MNKSLNQSFIPWIEISPRSFPDMVNTTPRLASVKNMSLPHVAKLSGFKLIPYSPTKEICVPSTSGTLAIAPPPVESLSKFFP